MEQEEQIYVNIEELDDTCCTKRQAAQETGTRPVRRDVVAGDATETCSTFKLSSICLGLLCFLLLAAVVGVGVKYDRDYNQLSRELANHTAEKHQLLLRNQNLTEERNNLKDTLRLMKLIGKCPDGWTQFGCSCYYLSTTMNTWAKSRQECSNRGADLVIGNSPEEMVFLNTLGVRLKFWIGLSQSSAQSNWMWTDGSSLETAHWQYGHPSMNSLRTQSCASFNSFTAGAFGQRVQSWTSELCARYLQWVCERKVKCSFCEKENLCEKGHLKNVKNGCC